jgi:putative phosphoesterase
VKIAALYDIHGNLPALEGVLSELGSIDMVLVGGDVVWGPWPQETMQALRSLRNVEFIMGNADRDVFERVNGQWKRTNDWCADRLADEDLAFLRSRSATFTADGVLFCHGSPRRDTDKITVATPQERIAAWCAGVKESTVVCGHTHSQFERQVGPWHIVNPGSVGNPFGDLGAYWAILNPDIEFRFTPYDVQTTAKKILATGYPYGERMAAQIVSRATAEDAARFFETHDQGEIAKP